MAAETPIKNYRHDDFNFFGLRPNVALKIKSSCWSDEHNRAFMFNSDFPL